MKYRRLEVYAPREPVHQAIALKNKLVQMFGGCTEYMGIGTWEGIEEPVFKFEVFTPGLHSTEAILTLEDALLRYKEDAKQECVLYVLDGNPVFLED